AERLEDVQDLVERPPDRVQVAAQWRQATGNRQIERWGLQLRLPRGAHQLLQASLESRLDPGSSSVDLLPDGPTLAGRDSTHQLEQTGELALFAEEIRAGAAQLRLVVGSGEPGSILLSERCQTLDDLGR